MKNLILTAYSCSKHSPCTSWSKQYLKGQTDLIAINGSSSSRFRSEGISIGKSFEDWLEDHGKAPTDYSRIGVVTFSAGWGFVHELINSPEALSWIDTIMIVDGLHCPLSQLSRWKQFAEDSRSGERKLIMAHSAIIPQGYPAASQTNDAVFDLACKWNERPDPAIPVPAPASFKAPLTITINGQHRTWTSFPAFSMRSIGEVKEYALAGADAPTHILMSRDVQEFLWSEELAPRFNSNDLWCGSNNLTT